MKERSVTIFLAEKITPLIYLIFPILATFSDDITRSKVEYVSIVIVFTITYMMIIFGYTKWRNNWLFILFIIHYAILIYFVFCNTPMNTLFFFFSAFALPFMLKVGIKSKFFVLFCMALAAALMMQYYIDQSHMFVLLVYYLVILMMCLGNIRAVHERHLKDQLNAKNEYINMLITEQERKRIGQDLHDTLGHVFAGMTLKAELAKKLIDQQPEQAKEEIEALADLSRQTLTKVRAIIEDLKTQTFDEEVHAVEHVLKDANISFDFYNANIAKTMSPVRQSTLAMILREAINNIIKHAHATKVEGNLINKQEKIILCVSDNGQGMRQPETVRLNSIEQRVAYLKGTLVIHSSKQQGTTIEVHIPRGEQL